MGSTIRDSVYVASTIQNVWKAPPQIAATPHNQLGYIRGQRRPGRPRAQYLSHGPGFQLYLTGDGAATLAVTRPG
jgi:hypothetical protein